MRVSGHSCSSRQTFSPITKIYHVLQRARGYLARRTQLPEVLPRRATAVVFDYLRHLIKPIGQVEQVFSDLGNVRLTRYLPDLLGDLAIMLAGRSSLIAMSPGGLFG